MDAAPRAAIRARAGLWAAAALAAATAAAADCPATETRIVELDLLGCRPAEVALDELAAGSRIWWLWDYLGAVARQAPGVVLRGRVVRGRRFEPPQTLGPWQVSGAEEEYFLATLDPDLCAALEPLPSVILVREVPCCDLIPPADVACLLELPQARAPTPLERQLAESTP